MFRILLASAFAFGPSAVAGDACNIVAARSHRGRATDSYSRGNLTGAVQELRIAIAVCPSEPLSRFMLANALYRIKRINEAASFYQSVVDRQSGNFEALMSLGFSRFELGDRDAAVEAWLTAMRLETDSPFARAALAVGLLATGDTDNALAQYEHAIGLDQSYGNIDVLAVDVRWKPEVRRHLKELKAVLEEKKEIP